MPDLDPPYAVMVDEQAASQLASRCRAAGLETEVLAGHAALSTVSAHAKVDYVMAGIVGAAGLLPNLAAARAGKRVMLANKGTAGDVRAAVHGRGARK